MSKELIELNNCSSTFGNIREIYKYTKNKNFKEILIISNSYHLKRIEFILRNYELDWKTESAEKILGIKPNKGFIETPKFIINYFYCLICNKKIK